MWKRNNFRPQFKFHRSQKNDFDCIRPSRRMRSTDRRQRDDRLILTSTRSTYAVESGAAGGRLARVRNSIPTSGLQGGVFATNAPAFPFEFRRKHVRPASRNSRFLFFNSLTYSTHDTGRSETGEMVSGTV